MSEYDDKADYNVYDFTQTTRPQQRSVYGASAAFAAHPSVAPAYSVPQAQVPCGLPHSAGDFAQIKIAASHDYETHDPTFYAQADADFPAYFDSGRRPLPEVVSYTPNQGRCGTRLTIYLRSVYDLDHLVHKPVIAFGRARRDIMLQKTSLPGQMFQYAVSVNAPTLSATGSLSPEVPLQLFFDDNSIAWDASSLEVGSFTFLDDTNYLPLDTPQFGSKKRKISPGASPRHSPGKKPSFLPAVSLTEDAATPLASDFSPNFRRGSIQEHYPSPRRFSSSGFSQTNNVGLLGMSPVQQYFTTQAVDTPPLLQTAQSPSWGYYPQVTATNAPTVAGAMRSPSVAAVSASSKTSQLLRSPTSTQNPPLIRTSTLQQSPIATTARAAADVGFNPYTMYPAKAQLKIEGDLEAMAKHWSDAEWSAGRRLVQFRRSQNGSLIAATFEAVTPEQRAPNSICVSCIWWEEKGECYVTSVDTISLLESLVAVRFTVEEKNRIRRNLEGYRPTTVSKSKAGSEDFFRLIMAFPNPKPRNIEKDVKVFPWRILPRALTKIIGKYSASYSSTAAALPVIATSAAGGSAAAYGPVAATVAPGHLSRTTPQGPNSSMSHGLQLSQLLPRQQQQQQQQRRYRQGVHLQQATANPVTLHSHAYASALRTDPYSPHALTLAPSSISMAGAMSNLRSSATAPIGLPSTTSWRQPAIAYGAGRGDGVSSAWGHSGAIRNQEQQQSSIDSHYAGSIGTPRFQYDALAATMPMSTSSLTGADAHHPPPPPPLSSSSLLTQPPPGHQGHGRRPAVSSSSSQTS